eukprot:2127959-Prymnesium_polylepis.1
MVRVAAVAVTDAGVTRVHRRFRLHVSTGRPLAAELPRRIARRVARRAARPVTVADCAAEPPTAPNRTRCVAVRAA